ncbi:MAG: hypothetical protein IPP93_16415 [Chitinophagaceae bacterium]|nr:hypothetical protein [Chitinophagaceae bacterium]
MQGLLKKIFLFLLVLTTAMSLPAQQPADTLHKSIIHVDQQWGYSCTAPAWFRILDTPEDMFGGALPPVDTTTNTIIIKGFPKNQFKDISSFENWVVKDYSVGQESKWDPGHIILLKNLIAGYTGPGIAYRVQILYEGVIYNCAYALIETSKAFLWVDFTATNTTYNKQYPLFLELVQSIKQL